MRAMQPTKAPARRALAVVVAALSTVLLACTPDLGPPSSLVTGNRILAVKAVPAEAKPGSDVAFTALVASPDGTLPMPGLGWTFCLSPKPLGQNNAVDDACLGSDPLLTIPLPGSGPSVSATLPKDGCSLFGPETPPQKTGEPPLRPRDADVTGGYYQPVRQIFVEGGPGDGDLYGFSFERITCDLASAPQDVVQAYQAAYHPNQNPRLTGVEGGPNPDDPGTFLPLPEDGLTPGTGPMPLAMAPMPPGSKITLRAQFSADSQESYPVFDVTTRTLVTHHETLRVSWFTNGGSLDHDATGRAEDDPTPTTDNVYTAPNNAGTARIWAVLRDSRGGVDYASYIVKVGQ